MSANSNGESIPILVTREMTEEQFARAGELGLEPVVVPAIRAVFPPLSRSLLRQAGHAERPIWVFTSRNGVEGFLQSIVPEKVVEEPVAIYAVGEVTAEALKKAGYDPKVPAQQDGVGLARRIVEDLGLSLSSVPGSQIKTESTDSDSKEGSGSARSGSDTPGVTVIHWCGNRRRPDLGQRLHRMKVLYVPVEVYRTELNRVDLPDRSVEAMLFYSPSAVEVFRKSNGFSGKLPELFAIGHTTAEQLSLESGGHVHVPVEPNTEALLQLVAEVLKGRTRT